MSNEASRPARERTGKSPDAFRTISEVSDEIEVPQHVLRFWETKFSQIKPLKRGGGRRYYRPEDIELLRAVRDLLYEEGYTIKGVQKILRTGGAKRIAGDAAQERKASGSREQATPASKPDGAAQKRGAAGMSASQRKALKDAIRELSELRDMLRSAPGSD